METIEYTVHSCSSYSGEFTPDRIKVDCPSDPKSRWLSDDSKTPQHITVKLTTPAILKVLVFGKYEKSHACNLRKFSVYGGMECDRMHLLFEGGVTDSSDAETFPLCHEVGGRSFPCQYLKVVPLQSWGGVLYSIWYMELQGVAEKAAVLQAEEWLHQYCRRQALRLCMKHLRECEYRDAYLSLCKQSRVELEHPQLSELHSLLVVRGDFTAAESIMDQASADGYLDKYVSEQPVQVYWSPVAVASDEKPGMRGGHQMCIDAVRETLYMFGGWDGTCDLCDLWQFSLTSMQWKCISADTSKEGGPSGRSCHKMCLDPHTQRLYLLGRYFNPTSHTQELPHPLLGDFFSYSIPDRTWQLLSEDTHAHGGPHLLYDHQMTFDPSTSTIYVFGGRVFTVPFLFYRAADSAHFIYSGLYSYNTTESQWTCIRPDYCGGSYAHELVPRMAHSQLLHPVNRTLYVIGGQRNKQPLSDIVTFDLQSEETEILANGKESCVPAAGFTIRTSLDSSRNEIHLLTGLNKFDSVNESVAEKGACSNSLWLYSIPSRTWTCLLSAPRYAHQFVFDPVSGCHYMFGGNLGKETAPKPQASMRLDDFWKLRLVRLTKEQLLKKIKLSIRQQQFYELAKTDQVQALSYLKASVSALVDHEDKEESAKFRQLASGLFATDCAGHGQPTRHSLFDMLSSYFPEHMAQPRDSVLDMVKL